MVNILKKVLEKVSIIVIAIFLVTNAAADEKIIQQEKISFAKCLNVITTSQSKLSLAPKITDVSAQMRIAVFMLVDGELTIKCDGQKNKITVSTTTN